jgi:hypothetical protein
LRKTLTAAALALALAGCTSTEKENEDPYPREAKENFVDACAAAAKGQSPQSAEADLRDQCQCVVDEMENRIPYARSGADNDFKDLDAAARDGRDLPGSLQDDVDQATATCVEDR